MSRDRFLAAVAVLAATAVLVLVLLLGDEDRPVRGGATTTTPGVTETLTDAAGETARTGTTQGLSPVPAPAVQRLPIGISEANPSLITGGGVPPEFSPARDALAALHPRYYRLVVDWAKLQPFADRPPDLATSADGCARGAPPCAPYAGILATLQAVRAAQERWGGYEVVVTFYGVPRWAAANVRGCERSDAGPKGRPVNDLGLIGYQGIVQAVRDLGQLAGVELKWWSPWNEANHPSFLSPQRRRCTTSAPSRAPIVYTKLVRAAREILGPGPQFVLGELAGYDGPSPRRTGISEFVRALPDDVACQGAVWSQHNYAEPDGKAPDAVGELEKVLQERPCTSGKPIWVTETGVGGADAGASRDITSAALSAQCRAQATLLRRWDADPRVQAVFQYSFREDVAYPVGLANVPLTSVYPTYDLWRAWAEARPNDPRPPQSPAGC